jgi:creatinine amidohydrolase
MKQALAGVIVLVSVGMGPTRAQAPQVRGVALADLAWPDAEPWLTSPSTVVVVPLGAGALEQGMHLKLNSDERLARYLASRVQAASAVVVAPSLNYHAYAAYADYPGSTSLSDGVARDMTVDVVKSLARSGARRFYVINTSAATMRMLQAAAKSLADAGILLGYTDPDLWTKGLAVLKQSNISVAHADEGATSMMLFVDPAAVDMTRAAKEYPIGRGVLTRQEGGRGVVSKSGVLGDATLATAQKGRFLVDALVAGIVDDIDKVRSAALPAVKSPTPPPPAPPPAAPQRPREEEKMPSGCTAGDDRAIRNVGNRFAYLWAELDADNISKLFTRMGDIRHPDGTIERGREVILANRTQLFMRREYHGSKHPIQLTDVRCLEGNTALADGKWELRLQEDPQSAPGRGLGAVRTNAGWCTLILVKNGDTWSIEAWRYTVNPPAGAPQPTLLSKPGYIGRGDLRIPHP